MSSFFKKRGGQVNAANVQITEVRPKRSSWDDLFVISYQFWFIELFACRPRLPWPSQTLMLRRSQKFRANSLEER